MGVSKATPQRQKPSKSKNSETFRRALIVGIGGLALATVGWVACNPKPPTGEKVANDFAAERADAQAETFRRAADKGDVETALRAIPGVVNGSAGRSAKFELVSYTGSLKPDETLIATVRVKARAAARGETDGEPGYDTGTAVRCFRFTTDRTGKGRVSNTTCPDDEVTTIAPDDPPSSSTTATQNRPPKQITGETEDNMRRWLLRTDPAAYNLDALEKAIDPDLSVLAVREGTSLGIAVQASAPHNECRLGRRNADGTVVIFAAPTTVQKPGGAGCLPESALHPPAEWE